jgi:hypothetical protein
LCLAERVAQPELCETGTDRALAKLKSNLLGEDQGHVLAPIGQAVNVVVVERIWNLFSKSASQSGCARKLGKDKLSPTPGRGRDGQCKNATGGKVPISSTPERPSGVRLARRKAVLRDTASLRRSMRRRTSPGRKAVLSGPFTNSTTGTCRSTSGEDQIVRVHSFLAGNGYDRAVERWPACSFGVKQCNRLPSTPKEDAHGLDYSNTC